MLVSSGKSEYGSGGLLNIASGDGKESGGSVRLSGGKGGNSGSTLELIGVETSSSTNAGGSVRVRTDSSLTSSSWNLSLETSNVASRGKSGDVKIKTVDSKSKLDR
mmetsp:Transcript_53949/g.63079  ORF Transcript_53949/g.63079 Transcript_53949/m.63079 type:complete len:106 (-) Transcript_53949:21-338(-)